jgi:hypothetical protein
VTVRHSIFEIRPDTFPDVYGSNARDAAVRRIIETIDASTFPWWRCVHTLRQNNRFPFPIEFMEPLDGADGYVSTNRMWLRPGHGMPTYEVIAHELAHVADLATLGTSFGQPWFNSANSEWRDQLMQAATWQGVEPPKSMSWNPSVLLNLQWNERPVEAISVPFTRAFWNDPKFHYPSWRFAGTWQWHDVEQVKQIFLSRSLQVFTDVPEEHTHFQAINRLAADGIVGGFPDGTFKPGEPVTRAQLATIITRVLDRK